MFFSAFISEMKSYIIRGLQANNLSQDSCIPFNSTKLDHFSRFRREWPFDLFTAYCSRMYSLNLRSLEIIRCTLGHRRALLYLKIKFHYYMTPSLACITSYVKLTQIRLKLNFVFDERKVFEVIWKLLQ
jgi:hypothetical protein